MGIRLMLIEDYSIFVKVANINISFIYINSITFMFNAALNYALNVVKFTHPPRKIKNPIL